MSTHSPAISPKSLYASLDKRRPQSIIDALGICIPFSRGENARSVP